MNYYLAGKFEERPDLHITLRYYPDVNTYDSFLIMSARLREWVKINRPVQQMWLFSRRVQVGPPGRPVWAWAPPPGFLVEESIMALREVVQPNSEAYPEFRPHVTAKGLPLILPKMLLMKRIDLMCKSKVLDTFTLTPVAGR